MKHLIPILLITLSSSAFGQSTFIPNALKTDTVMLKKLEDRGRLDARQDVDSGKLIVKWYGLPSGAEGNYEALLYSYGARVAWQPLETLPLEIGMRFLSSYGQMEEYIPEANPNAVPGIGSTWGTDQHMELYRLEVPVLYRIPLGGKFMLALGVSAGAGRVQAADRVTEYDIRTGAYLGDL